MSNLSYVVSLTLAGNMQAQLQQTYKTIQQTQQQAQKLNNQCNQLGKVNFTQKLLGGLGKVRDAFGVVGLGAIKFLKSCADSATGAEKVNVDLAATIKSTKGAAGETVESISNMASKFSGLTTYSAGTIKTGQNMLLTFTNIGKKVFPDATSAMLDMATKMKSDLPHTAIQLGKALNDPVNGITALKRVGVTFTEKQTDVIKKLVETGHTATAQKVILAELNKEFGGQAQAQANTYAGKMLQMQNAFNSMKVAIGTELLPHLTKFTQAFSGIVLKVIDFVKNNKTLVTTVLTAVGAFGSLIGGLSVVKKFIGIISPMASTLGTTISGLILPILLIVGAITAFTLAYQKDFHGFKTLVDDVLGKVTKGIEAFKDVITGDYAGAMGIMVSKFGMSGHSAKQFLKIIQSARADISDAIGKIKDVVVGTFNFILDHGSQIKPVVAGIAGAFITYKIAMLGVTLATKAMNAVTQIAIIVQRLLNATLIVNPITIIILAIGALIGVLIYFYNTNKTVKKIVDIVWNGIKTVISIIINVLKIAFMLWFTKIKIELTVIKAVFSVVFNVIKTIVLTVIDVILGAFKGLGKGIKSIFESVASVVKGVFNIGIKAINFLIGGLNKFKITTPKWLPFGMGGKKFGFDIPKIPMLAKGTNDFIGGMALVGEKGPELVNMPAHSQVIPNPQTKKILSRPKSERGINITIPKLAEQIIIREDADIDKFADALVKKIEITSMNMEG